MQNQNVENEMPIAMPSRGLFRCLSWKIGLRILVLSLLAAGVLGAVGMNQVMPKPPTCARGFLDRFVWYVNQGQMHADMHTLASAVQYVMASESPLPAAMVPPDQHLTQNPPRTSPKS